MTDVARLMATGLADAHAGKSAVKPLVDQLVPQVNPKLAEWSSPSTLPGDTPG